jgi:carbon monoxide dehydrogenase subunit G
MTVFTVTTASQATVDADRAAVWAALTDPALITRLTPYLHAIDVHGDRWVWHLVRIPVLGAMTSPSFTEVMTYDEPSQITFVHDPERPDEKAGVEGSYHLKDVPDGTHLQIELEITVDLPFPRVARPGIQTAMRAVVAAMGARFSANLVRHLKRTR